ncbi:hypothetical protein CR513_49460, partial [Mucuna pruriens]
MSPYWIIFGKVYHLLVEIKHRAYWAIKKCNMAYDQADKETYENSQIYKKKVKQFHDNKILRKEFRVGQKVLLFNSRLKLIVGKLRSRWDGTFVVTNIFSYAVVELRDEANNRNLKINRHWINPYREGPTPMVGEMESILLMEPTLLEDTP